MKKYSSALIIAVSAGIAACIYKASLDRATTAYYRLLVSGSKCDNKK